MYNLKKILICVVCLAFVFGATATFLIEKNKPEIIEINGIIPELTEQELILNSDIIVKGNVLEIGESKWSNPKSIKGKRNILQTDITVKINEILSGEYSSRNVVVRIDKGYDKKSNTVMESSGYPDFEVGENVILFLSRDDGDLLTDEDYFVLTGMKNGKWLLNDENQITSKLNSSKSNSLDILKDKIREEKQNNPDWKEQKAKEKQQIIEKNKELFGE